MFRLLTNIISKCAAGQLRFIFLGCANDIFPFRASLPILLSRLDEFFQPSNALFTEIAFRILERTIDCSFGASNFFF